MSELVKYPALLDAEGKPVQVKRVSVLGDFDPAVHMPIVASDFANEGAFDRWVVNSKKIDFPALIGEDGEKVKIKSLDQLRGYDKKVHRSIKESDFEDETMYLEMQADRLEQRAKALREEAVQARKLGSVAERARAKKLVQMQKRIAELTESLTADGVDVEALLAAAKEI